MNILINFSTQRRQGGAKTQKRDFSFASLRLLGAFAWTLLIILPAAQVHAQASGGMKLGPKHQAYVDSIKNSNYRWTFPLLGKKLSKRGFDMQYPFGIMSNNLIGTQKVVISDLKVGFNDMEPVPLDFIKFGEVKAQATTTNLRADMWVLPFLDIYALGGATWTKTNVQIAEPVSFNTEANFNGNTFGFGTTLAGGWHGLIAIMDFNHTWTSLSNIKGAIQATMFTVRIGKNFVFKTRPDQNITVWAGPSGFFVNRTTEGTVDLNDLKGGGSKSDMQAIVNGTPPWYDNLTPAQKVVVKAIAQKIIDKIDSGHVSDATIHYSLNKRPTSNWSMVAGGQFQLNHSWQFRTEFGFLGGKNSVLLSVNFRWR